MIPKIKGTHDFIDMRLYNAIINKAKTHFSLYNFIEIATPLLESVELFKRSLGIYTDVVSKEMFTIEKHSPKSESICLRPEMTASAVRAFIENNVDTVPWRIFSFGPVFRYERPQKGRYRQFHQLTVEMIGAGSVGYDVQLITMLDRFFHEKLHISTYALIINFLGCTADRIVYKDILKDFLKKYQSHLCSTCITRMDTNTLRVFDCKNDVCQTYYKNAPVTTQSLCQECAHEWSQIKHYLSLLSVSYSHKSTLVRGLDYYNKTAFEFVSDNLGAQNTFCGGGRYDGLVNQIDGRKEQPAIGAGIGIERLILLLEGQENMLLSDKVQPSYVMIPLTPEQLPLVLLLSDTLMAHSIKLELLLDGSLKSMMRKANKMEAQAVIFIGPEEQAQGTALVKNMVTGNQHHVAHIELAAYLQSNT